MSGFLRRVPRTPMRGESVTAVKLFAGRKYVISLAVPFVSYGYRRLYGWAFSGADQGQVADRPPQEGPG